MIHHLLTKDLDILYREHIEQFKNNFFNLTQAKNKVLIFDPSFCTSKACGSFYCYLSYLRGIDGLFLVLDPTDKSIKLAYNKAEMRSSRNVAFHGNQYLSVNYSSHFYDGVIEDFHFDKLEEKYYVVQHLHISNHNLEFSVEIRELLECLRKFKSDYEIACIMKANQIALRGHRVVSQAFYDNAFKHNLSNELNFYYMYLSATRSMADSMPYEPIVALNHSAAILHYQALADFEQSSHSLLLDAGVYYRGYASDITKTHSDDPRWKDIIDHISLIQRMIIDNLQIGHNFYESHLYSRRLIADFLIKFKFVSNVTNEENFIEFVLKNEIDRIFYPHGLGHLIGLDVHDVGKDMYIKDGVVVKNKLNNDQIRSNFRIDNNVVFTIEPGFYLILDLIDSCDYETKKYLNQFTIKEFLKFGGIRIETNVVIYNNQIYDITKLLENK